MDDNNLEDASRIEEMIKDINKEMDDKKFMFEESSDEDYWFFYDFFDDSILFCLIFKLFCWIFW